MDMINASPRDTNIKPKQLRRAGIVPCVIYGAGLVKSLPVQIPSVTARQLRQTRRVGSLVDVKLDGERYHTLIKELAADTLTDEVMHICFQLLEKGRKANSVADIVLKNRDKVQGYIEQIQMQVPHAAEPEYLLDTVTVDLNGCPIGTVIRVVDIPEFQSGNIELQTDPGNIVLRISGKKLPLSERTDTDDAPDISAPPADQAAPDSK